MYSGFNGTYDFDWTICRLSQIDENVKNFENVEKYRKRKRKNHQNSENSQNAGAWAVLNVKFIKR